jgi:hypothetical protein
VASFVKAAAGVSILCKESGYAAVALIACHAIRVEKRWSTGLRLAAPAVIVAAVLGDNNRLLAQNISVDPSGRYYRNSSGQPLFLLGYYDWAAVPNGYYIDHPSQYLQMMQQGAPYKINYIRISLGVNRHTASTNPPKSGEKDAPSAIITVR